MTDILIILLLSALQLASGFGILCYLKIDQKPAIQFAVAMLLGIAVFSFVPFILQLAFVPLTAFNIFGAILIGCLLLNLSSKRSFLALLKVCSTFRPRLRLYELPFVLLLSLAFFVSAWRCFYYPPTSRDLTSGPEVIAAYTIKEKTMVNSVFSVDLQTTNNQFKPAFLTSLQVIYKYAGFPFGQVWLSSVFLFFLVFLYAVLRQELHRAVAWMLMVMFVAIPETYAYTVMVLFDYSNAVYLCLALYFLLSFLKSSATGALVLSGILMAVATYVRSETLVLAFLLGTAMLFHFWNSPVPVWKRIKAGGLFLLPAVVIYLLSITVYINFYLPAGYEVGNLLNKSILSPRGFLQRLADMTTRLLFSRGINYYSYFGHVFCLVVLLSFFYRRRWNRTSLFWLFAVLVVYNGIALLGHLFPLFDLTNTTKRALFKVFPLMLLFMANSPPLTTLSERINRWENRGQEENRVGEGLTTV